MLSDWVGYGVRLVFAPGQIAAHVVVPETIRESMSKVWRLSTTPVGVVPAAAFRSVEAAMLEGVVCRVTVEVWSFIVGSVNDVVRLGLYCASVGFALMNCWSGMFFSCSM